jgi:peroxiredoxin
MVALGTACPEFRLTDTVSGKVVDRRDLSASAALLVMFICNHCPFVKHVRAELARLGRDYGPRGVAIVAISSNDAEAYPQDGPEAMKAEAVEAGYSFPYLYDKTQEVARAFGAVCTPDFFLFGPDGRLAYRGQLDDSRPSTRSFAGNAEAVTGRDLRAALDAVLSGQTVNPAQRPSIGCNVKWRAKAGA